MNHSGFFFRAAVLLFICASLVLPTAATDWSITDVGAGPSFHLGTERAVSYLNADGEYISLVYSTETGGNVAFYVYRNTDGTEETNEIFHVPSSWENMGVDGGYAHYALTITETLLNSPQATPYVIGTFNNYTPEVNVGQVFFSDAEGGAGAYNLSAVVIEEMDINFWEQSLASAAWQEGETDKVGILYFRGNPGDARYSLVYREGTPTGGATPAFGAETVIAQVDYPGVCAFSRGGDGRLHAIYSYGIYAGTEGLVYAYSTNGGTEWTPIEAVSTFTGWYFDSVAIAATDDGLAHFLFTNRLNPGTYRVIYGRSDSLLSYRYFQIDLEPVTFYSDIAPDLSIAVGSDGMVRAALPLSPAEGADELMYATYNPETDWTSETVATYTTISRCSLAVQSDGENDVPVIAYEASAGEGSLIAYAMPDSSPAFTLAADPTSGDASLAVTFNLTQNRENGAVRSGDEYLLGFFTFGEGTYGRMLWNVDDPYTAAHTYTGAGSYATALTVFGIDISEMENYDISEDDIGNLTLVSAQVMSGTIMPVYAVVVDDCPTITVTVATATPTATPVVTVNDDDDSPDLTKTPTPTPEPAAPVGDGNATASEPMETPTPEPSVTATPEPTTVPEVTPTAEPTDNGPVPVGPIEQAAQQNTTGGFPWLWGILIVVIIGAGAFVLMNGQKK